MIEILFKAKRKDWKELPREQWWVEGYYLNIAKINHFICTGKIKLDGAVKGIIAPEMYEIDPDTLCQYTGLNDNTKWEELTESEKELFLSNWNYQEDRKNKVEDWNGKKIWEHDILKAHLDESYPEDITYIKILWNECRFCTNENYSMDIETLEKWDAELFQVCGNIFDNPELLEVE